MPTGFFSRPVDFIGFIKIFVYKNNLTFQQIVPQNKRFDIRKLSRIPCQLNPYEINIK